MKKHSDVIKSLIKRAFSLKLHFLLIGVFIVWPSIHAQDLVFLRDSTTLEGKVTHAGRDWVVLKPADTLQGLERRIPTKLIDYIRYENKNIQYYFTGTSRAPLSLPNDTTGLNDEQLRMRAQLDATRGNQQFPGGIASGLMAFFLTPVGGLIPTVAISLSTPPGKRWIYADSSLMNRPAYAEAYRKEIRKEKQLYTWKQYIQGSRTFFFLVALVGCYIWLK
ncbi:MAG: hypothetical protein KJS92_03900 [Bacteroidetes bacterium]|nr:hypothetical protein [Bacteroidota bacterium]